jgi:uncharacterized protein (TIGR03435 family)
MSWTYYGHGEPGTVGSDSQTKQVILNAPKWADEDQFSIEATAQDVGNVTQAELIGMVEALLAERFNLKFHRETRQISVLVLIATRGGPKLQEPTGKEEHPEVIGSFPPLVRLSASKHRCGV